MKPRLLLQTVALALSVTGMLSAPPASAEQVQDVRLGSHQGKTRLVFDLSGPTDYSVSSTEAPPRIIIDFPTASPSELPRLSFTDTPIAAMHVSQGNSGGLQIIIDLGKPAGSDSFFLAPHLTRGHRLVLDVYEQEPPAVALKSPEPPTAPPPPPSRGAEPARLPSSATRSPRETMSARVAPPSETDHPTFELSGTWQQEWAYRTKNAGNQKFEAVVQPRLDVSFASGAQLAAIFRVRLDAVGDLGPDVYRPDNYSEVNGPSYNTEHAEFSLRELYFDTRWAGAYWRLGKQQVVWGQADGIKVLDVVNPQSFREFILDDFDDSRIPLWMLNAELPLGEGGLQLLWIPDTTYHELAEIGAPYFLTSPKWVPGIAPGTNVQLSSFDKPDNALEDSDAGVRYTAFLAGWDISLNYLYHYQDYPVLYQESQRQNNTDILRIAPAYKRNNLLGATLSNAFDELTLRAELAYSSDTYHTTNSPINRGIRNSSEFASVIGLDWQYSGDGLLSAQWFFSHLPDYSPDIVRDENENTFSLLFQQGFANEAWQLRALGLYSLDDEDSLLQLKLRYWLLGNLELWLGGDFFNGTRRGSFGQFEQQSRILLGLEYGF